MLGQSVLVGGQSPNMTYIIVADRSHDTCWTHSRQGATQLLTGSYTDDAASMKAGSCLFTQVWVDADLTPPESSLLEVPVPRQQTLASGTQVVASCLDSLEPIVLDNFVDEHDLRECLRAGATVPAVAGPPVVHR